MIETQTYQPSEQLNDELLQQHELAVVQQGLGVVAMQREVVVGDGLDASLELLNAEANGVAARPEDAGRVHDMEAAHAEAFEEKALLDAYDEALMMNEIFDAHTAALEEDSNRDEAAAESLAATEEAADNSASKSAVLDSVAESEPEPTADGQALAEQLLKEAGYIGDAPAGTVVQRDAETGNLIVTNSLNRNVQIIEQMPGGGSRVMDYEFDDATSTLTIKAQGNNVMTARVGDYVSADGSEDSAEAEYIELPPAVVRAVGFARATPVRAAH